MRNDTGNQQQYEDHELPCGCITSAWLGANGGYCASIRYSSKCRDSAHRAAETRRRRKDSGEVVAR